MKPPAFVLDANVFIQAAREYYAFDLAPAFWDNLVDRANNGQVLSIDYVKKELERLNDELSVWAERKFGSAFASTNQQDVLECYAKIINWVQAQKQFLNYAISDFAKGADGWLIAYAMAKDCIVVTHEVLAIYAKKRVKIPNVCQAFNVSCMNTFEMLRILGMRWA